MPYCIYKLKKTIKVSLDQWSHVFPVQSTYKKVEMKSDGKSDEIRKSGSIVSDYDLSDLSSSYGVLQAQGSGDLVIR